MSSEKSFQKYFMKLVNGYRTALVSGGGFPDCLIVNGDITYYVELKLLKIGPSGDKMLRGLYKPTQIPWHLDYLTHKKGKRLYTLFKLDGKYGIVHETDEYCFAVMNRLKYSGLADHQYKEYKVLKELIKEEFE